MKRTAIKVTMGMVAAGVMTMHATAAHARWYQLEGACARSIANNGNQVWALSCGGGSDGGGYSYNGSPTQAGHSWSPQLGNGTQIALAVDAISGNVYPWIIKSNNELWHWDWVTNEWSDTHYTASSIAADTDGYGGGSRVWITGVGNGDQPIYQWLFDPSFDSGTFHQIGVGGAGRTVTAFIPNASGYANAFYPGEVYLSVTNSNLYQWGWTFQSWILQGSGITNMTNQHALANGRVYQWTNGTWTPDNSLSGSSDTACAAYPNGAPITQLAYPTTYTAGEACLWGMDACGNVLCDDSCCSHLIQ